MKILKMKRRRVGKSKTAIFYFDIDQRININYTVKPGIRREDVIALIQTTMEVVYNDTIEYMKKNPQVEYDNFQFLIEKIQTMLKIIEYGCCIET